MGVFTAIGIIVAGLVAMAVAWLAWEMAGNIYGGIKGAYRLSRAIEKKFPHWQLIRYGLRNWSGEGRYNGHCGTYMQIGGMRVPLDGRDPIVRDRYPG